MLEKYPTIYRDQFGEEVTTIENNGSFLRMVIRGVEFESSMLDDWEAVTPLETTQLVSFPLRGNELCSYSLDFEMPVPVVVSDRIIQAILRVHFELGKPKPNGAIDREELQLELLVEGQSFKSQGKYGWFEDALREIHEILPAGMFIKSCFSCAYSDYSPAGSGAFGCMACFRNSKQAYLSLKGKAAYFNLQKEIAEYVQETYLCPEFEKRVAGTGYRG